MFTSTFVKIMCLCIFWHVGSIVIDPFTMTRSDIIKYTFDQVSSIYVVSVS